ncbi:MAG: TraX family protein [Butyricicoccaceae bacterium]
MDGTKTRGLVAKGLNGNQLKVIAIIAMTVDHVLWAIFPGYDNGPVIYVLHCIGRLTAPIMCFFIAEGYHYTRNLKKYAARLFAFAIISHFAYNFAFGIPFVPFRTGVFNQTSVMWSLAWGLVTLAIVESDRPQWQKIAAITVICVLSFPSDWSCIAVLVIMGFGTNRGDFKKQAWNLVLYVAMYAAVYVIFIDAAYGILQMAVVLSLPLLRRYNGQRGSWKGMKWFFYLYYPAHLVAVGLIRVWLHGNVGVLVGGA